MTSPTTSIRTTAKKALTDTLTTALDPVQVAYGNPGPHVERETVFVGGPLPGTVNYPTFDTTSGRKLREDRFVLHVVILALVEGGTEYDAEVRAEELYAELEDVFAAADPLSTVDGILSAELGPNVTGPDGESIDGGAQAMIIADVTIQAELH